MILPLVRGALWASPPPDVSARQQSMTTWHVNARVGEGGVWWTACGGAFFRATAEVLDADLLDVCLPCLAKRAEQPRRAYRQLPASEPGAKDWLNSAVAALPRSSTMLVRNPVLALPGVAQLQALDPEARAALRTILMDIRADAHEQADRSWRKRKAPMAAYWRAVAVYAGHIARALR